MCMGHSCRSEEHSDIHHIHSHDDHTGHYSIARGQLQGQLRHQLRQWAQLLSSSFQPRLQELPQQERQQQRQGHSQNKILEHRGQIFPHCSGSQQQGRQQCTLQGRGQNILQGRPHGYRPEGGDQLSRQSQGQPQPWYKQQLLAPTETSCCYCSVIAGSLLSPC